MYSPALPLGILDLAVAPLPLATTSLRPSGVTRTDVGVLPGQDLLEQVGVAHQPLARRVIQSHRDGVRRQVDEHPARDDAADGCPGADAQPAGTAGLHVITAQTAIVAEPRMVDVTGKSGDEVEPAT